MIGCTVKADQNKVSLLIFHYEKNVHYITVK